MKKRLKVLLRKRRRSLQYHLRGAKAPQAKMYWYGRLDELKALSRESSAEAK